MSKIYSENQNVIKKFGLQTEKSVNLKSEALKSKLTDLLEYQGQREKM